tara:strand:+ start:1293 stop:1502 length:210 start_codon:yes stop_codon:yes gene_type:complete
MIDAFIIGFLGLFVADNYEFIKTAKEQMKQGYEWKYVGYKEWDGKSPALIIDRDTHPHVYWKLVKPEEK